MKQPKIDEIKAAVEQLMKNLPTVISALNYYAGMSYRTPDEEAEYQKLLELVQQANQVLAYCADFMDNKLYCDATAIYYEIKQMAEQGNPGAKAALADLAPLFAKSLLDQTDNN